MTDEAAARSRAVHRLMGDARAAERLSQALEAIVRDIVVTSHVEHDCVDKDALRRLLEITLRTASNDALAALADGLDRVFATCSMPQLDRIVIGRRRRELGLD